MFYFFNLKLGLIVHYVLLVGIHKFMKNIKKNNSMKNHKPVTLSIKKKRVNYKNTIFKIQQRTELKPPK